MAEKNTPVQLYPGTTLDDLYKTCIFRALSQGMKDREALDIIASLWTAGLPGAYIALERFCCDLLNEQDKER